MLPELAEIEAALTEEREVCAHLGLRERFFGRTNLPNGDLGTVVQVQYSTMILQVRVETHMQMKCAIIELSAGGCAYCANPKTRYNATTIMINLPDDGLYDLLVCNTCASVKRELHTAYSANSENYTEGFASPDRDQLCSNFVMTMSHSNPSITLRNSGRSPPSTDHSRLATCGQRVNPPDTPQSHRGGSRSPSTLPPPYTISDTHCGQTPIKFNSVAGN